MTLRLQTAATGVARAAHYVIPTGATQPIQTLLLEPQRTNLCIRSEEFDTWTLTLASVNSNTFVAPNGTTTGDELFPSASNGRVRRVVTFTGNGEKCVSVYLRAGTSVQSSVRLRDMGVPADLHTVRVTWVDGVPTATTVAGSGTIYPIEAVSAGWYRITFSVLGVVAANTNEVQIYPDDLNGTGSVVAWGAQAEDARVPSSYIPTEATAITRNADSLYFPYTPPPQAMTLYLRGIERGRPSAVTAAFEYLAFIGGANVATSPRLGVFRSSASAGYAALHHPASTTTTASVGSAAVRGDIVELRVTLNVGGAPRIGVSINGGAETLSALATAQPLSNLWAAQRIYLGSPSLIGEFAFTHMAVASGGLDMGEMRNIAGVA